MEFLTTLEYRLSLIKLPPKFHPKLCATRLIFITPPPQFTSQFYATNPRCVVAPLPMKLLENPILEAFKKIFVTLEMYPTCT